MKITKIVSAIAAVTLLTSSLAIAAEDTEPKAIQDLKVLVDQVRTKLNEGKKSEADLEKELKQFDELVAKHKDKDAESASRILQMKAMLYLQVLDNTEKTIAEIERLKKELPETELAKGADQMIESIKAQEEGKKIQRSLAQGTKFPPFEVKSLEGKPLKLEDYKNKVVLIDFWATWCGPCIAELPNVKDAYEKHHGKGFEIIGISLDQSEEKLKEFIKSKEMPWPQYFDGKGWQNALAVKYGVNSIPATYLLDREGKIIGQGLRGEQLEKAVASALAAK